MSRIGHCFRELRAIGRKALIPYISAGDPSALGTLKLMHALVEAGANLIELGVPFSDPMADGPVKFIGNLEDDLKIEEKLYYCYIG